MAFVVIVALLLGVLFTVSRKRAHGNTWFPENFFGHGSKAGTKSSDRRRGPEGEELHNGQSLGNQASGGVDSSLEASATLSPEWSDDDSISKAKKFKVTNGWIEFHIKWF